MRGWRRWALLVVCCILVFLPAAAQKITPPDDRCVREPCVYDVPDRELLPNHPFYILLHNVDTADRLSVGLSEVRCPKPPCPPILIYFLRESEFDKLMDGQRFRPDDGSLTNASMPTQEHYEAHTVITGFEERYYSVLLNPGTQPVVADVQVTFQVADCLLFLTSLLFVPLLLLSLCFFMFRTANKTPRYVSGLPQQQRALTACCCEYTIGDPTEDRPPAPCCDNYAYKLPRWDWCWGYPARLWRRPSVSWAHWWRQQVLVTWPWNPEEDESLDLGARQIYVLIILLFNLLVQTIWHELLVTANSSVIRVMPSGMASYWSRYLGSTFFQYLFYAIFKPLLTVLFVVAPEWRRDRSKCWRITGAILEHALQIVFFIVLAAVCYSTLTLLRMYRCSVLLTSLIIPYFSFELLKMVLVFGFIPLPLWYCLLNTFGPEIPLQPGPGYSGPPSAYPPPPSNVMQARGLSSQRPYGRSYHGGLDEEDEALSDETVPLRG